MDTRRGLFTLVSIASAATPVGLVVGAGLGSYAAWRWLKGKKK